MGTGVFKPWFKVLLAAVVYAALPVTILSNPLNQYYSAPQSEYYQSSYQPAASYQPATSYQPAASYQSYQPVYQASYAEPYQPEYQPSYQQTYQPSYQQTYQPSYQQTYQPSYQQSYQPEYQSYQPVYQQKEYYPEYVNYEAITYQELNETIHCGVIPAVNKELYQNSYGGYQYEPDYSSGYGKSNNYAVGTKTLPFGEQPWIVVITDDYNNFLCQGAIVNSHFVLTVASCVEYIAAEKLRVRYGDWDLLNNANEYEAYKNLEVRVCRKLPLGCDYGYSYGYNSYAQGSKLVLLDTEKEPDSDEYPQVRPVCLPKYYQNYYQAPAYQPAYTPSYQASSSYAAATYTAPTYQQNYQPAYTPTYAPSYEPTYEYSECFVAGWYGSPTTSLQNHERPTYDASYNYGYNSNYPQQSSAYSYGSSYYQQSKIPKVAQVKEIKCDSYGGYGQYKNSYAGCDESICLVGVYGDACVADKGAAVICLVKEKYGYDSGYSNYEPSNYEYATASPGYGYDQPQQYGYGYKQDSYYKKEIKALPAGYEQYYRKRAAIVAVVDYPAQCSTSYKPQQYGYGYQQQEYQSKPLVAVKVTQKIVDVIVDKFWEGAEDYSCPAPKPYYKEPYYVEPTYSSYQTYQPEYTAPAYQSYEQPAYQSYQPAYTAPTYQAPAYQSYEQPAYQAPAYQTYEQPAYSTYQAPAYQSYEQPAYQAPAYQSYEQPAYQAPAYQAPAYQSYEQPAYQAPAYQTYEQPSYSTYQAPTYQAPAYQSYEQPSYQPSYAAPTYQASTYQSYSPPPAYSG